MRTLTSIMPADGCTSLNQHVPVKTCDVIHRYRLLFSYRFLGLLLDVGTLGTAPTKLLTGGLLQHPAF